MLTLNITMLELKVEQLLALSIFSAYFILIVWLSSVVFQSIRNAASQNTEGRKTTKIALFSGLTLTSFAHTWFYMFKYMSWSFANYGMHHAKGNVGPLLERISNWLLDTSLFEQAWAAVCFGRMNWWWSEQLCLFTVGAWTVFLFAQGTRYRIQHLWAYMLLGQVVAISVAANLFYIAILCSRPADFNDKTRLPFKLWASVFLSLLTVAASPFTDDRTFLPNLLLMHVLLVVPLISTSTSPSKYTLSLSSVYLLVFLASIPIRSRTVLAALSTLKPAEQSPLGLFERAWDVLHSHPAQSSIGWDVVWSTLSFVLWTVLTPSPSKWFTVPYLLVATPFASLGVTAPYVLRPRHREPEGKEE